MVTVWEAVMVYTADNTALFIMPDFIAIALIVTGEVMTIGLEYDVPFVSGSFPSVV
ncbi:hypothetical protein FACS189450_11260 [Spirochaetia bacterium]|nr:hypothetical protein FACS189450_11260 [Spirochaetia bacterium]